MKNVLVIKGMVVEELERIENLSGIQELSAGYTQFIYIGKSTILAHQCSMWMCKLENKVLETQIYFRPF